MTFLTDIPVIQAPMAGSQGSVLAIAVSNAGGLGSLLGVKLGIPRTPDTLVQRSRVLAVLDPRLRTKGYGRRFLASLPPAPVVHELQAVETFLKSSIV